VPKDFFADNVSMKSHLLDDMLRFLKHASPLEIFWPTLCVFLQFSVLDEKGVLDETTCVIGISRRRTKRRQQIVFGWDNIHLKFEKIWLNSHSGRALYF